MRFFSLRSLIVNSTFYAAYLTAANVQVYKEKKTLPVSVLHVCFRLLESTVITCSPLFYLSAEVCHLKASLRSLPSAASLRYLTLLWRRLEYNSVEYCYRVDRLFYINISLCKLYFQNKINPQITVVQSRNTCTLFFFH